MEAKLVYKDRLAFGDRDFAEFVIWQVPSPVPPSTHFIKYRLAYIVDGVRVIGFDNERGKGNHRHEDGIETSYRFRDVEQLIREFITSVRQWREQHGKA